MEAAFFGFEVAAHGLAAAAAFNPIGAAFMAVAAIAIVAIVWANC